MAMQERMCRRLAVLATGLLVALWLPAPDARGQQRSGPPLDAAAMRAIEQASASVLGLRVRAVDDARSARTLGLEREGSGVVIGPDGLVLTIGYLILEAQSLSLLTEDGRSLPARVVAYDLASGLGLVQPLVPLPMDPVRLGPPPAAGSGEPVVVASGGLQGEVSLARLVSRRPFSGYWEYHLDEALFTTPARQDHSGAALFNARGELVGIGSLVVGDAEGTGPVGSLGNLFVPTALLPPILSELRQHGRSRASRRAWLGLNCSEIDGAVVVLRTSSESPAEQAGLRPGDRIVAIDGVGVASLAALWKALWSGGPPERAVRLQVQRQGLAQDVIVQAIDRASTLRQAEGI